MPPAGRLPNQVKCASRAGLAGVARVLGALLLPTVLLAQTPGPNRSVVSGVVRPLDPTDPETVIKTDVLRQRQNEPVMAVSSTNAEHLLAAANDYRTIDIPDDMGTGDSDDGPFARAFSRVAAFFTRLLGIAPEPSPPIAASEAWMGVYRSCDRGRTWIGSLLPGSSTDSSEASLASPLRGLQAASDPDLAPAPGGRAYLAGLAFNRGGDSAIFVARYADRNDREGGACFAYEFTRVVGTGKDKRFVDLPTVAADVTRATMDGPKRYVYVAYTEFKDKKDKDKSRIFFSRSGDDGLTWSEPLSVSDGYKLNQGADLAIDPVDGTVYIVWRDFIGHRILMVRSIDFGTTWSEPVAVHEGSIAAFDQPTGPDRFRTNGFPTVAIDGTGRVFVAWQEKVDSLGYPDPSGSPRIVMTMSESITDTGVTWTPRRAVDMAPRTEEAIQRGLGDVVTRPSGVQVMPVLSANAGQLRLLYAEARGDTLAGVDVKLDMRVAELDPVTGALFPGRPSVQVSEYSVQASTPPELVETVPGYSARHRPNLPMFRGGTVPFVGDYKMLAPAQPFVRQADGSWRWASNPGDAIAPSFHAIWTDNRNVEFPDGDILGDWTVYGPPDTGALSCVNPGSRDQDVLTSEISGDLVAGTPSLFKPLLRPTGEPMPRAFVVYVENRTPVSRFVVLALVADGPDTSASFDQFDPFLTSLPEGDDLLHDAVEILPYSTLTRTAYMESARADATARFEVTDPDTGGLLARVVLNQTPSTYPLTNTAISDYEVHNPRISNPRISNPRISNPRISNPRISNSTVTNPRISNPRISNESLSDSFFDARDLTFVMTNAGNTTTVYDLQTFIPEEIADDDGYEFQLIIYRTVAAVGTDIDPFEEDCSAVEVLHDEFISSIETPRISNPRISNPRISNEDVQSPRISNPRISNATFYLEPAEGPVVPTPAEVSAVASSRAAGDESLVKSALAASAEAAVAASATASATADTGDLSAPLAVPQIRWTLRIFQVGGLEMDTPTLDEIAPASEAQPPLVSAAIVSQSTNVVAGVKEEDPPYVLFGTEPPPPQKEVDGELVPFTEPVNPPDSLAFAQGPMSTPVNEPLPPVVVRIADATGETAVVTGIPVTLALGAGSPPGTLAGILTRSSENGSATFDDLVIDTEGSGYTLVASSPDLAGATSAPFDVVSPGADRLAFVTQPSDTAPSATMPPIAVQIQDAAGIPLPGRTDVVTLTASGGPGVLSGTTARNAVGGIATFDDLSIDVAAEGYALQASAPGLVSGTSQPFDVVAPGEPLVLMVTSTGDAGPGTLRQALLDANANVGHRDVIVFDVPAPYTIAPAAALPVVTDPVVIDGTTQPGHAGVPIVQIDGSGSVLAHGLSVSAGGSIIRGLAIHGFDLAGIFLNRGGGSTIEGNYLGTNPAGSGGIGNASGLETQDSSGNLVSANVLSGNAGSGLRMRGGRGNRVQGNRIGTHPAGTAALPNGEDGITTWPSSIGTVPVADTSIQGNLISGNGRHGINLQPVSGPLGPVSAEDTEILGNTIGLDVDGNALGNASWGIWAQYASGLVIGRPSNGNVISGNTASGISISGAGAVPAIVQANRIGTDPTGTLSRGNGGGGIEVVNSPGNQIGGSAPGEENLISNLNKTGIFVQGLTATGNVIEGNLIGTNADGHTPVGPQSVGIHLRYGPSDTVIRGNVISGNSGYGVRVESSSGGPIARTLIQANRIGTDSAGAEAVPNALDGVQLVEPFTTDSTIRDNVISGNLHHGIQIREGTRTEILANRIGTNAAGTAALGNGWSGIETRDADRTTIGRPGEGNVISGNGWTGISIISSAGSNRVQANKIGTEASGAIALANLQHGIRLSATGGDIIGGWNAGEGNVISGNIGDGIYMEGAVGVVVAGNWIGTNDSGADLGNGGSGVTMSLSCSTNSIGGLGPDGNVIAFNAGYGVRDTGGSTGTHILGNSIFSNGLLGILDNGMLDAPMLTSANTSGGTTTVAGSVTDLSGLYSSFRIEFFWSTTCDASGSGEGEVFLGRTEVTSGGGGTASFSASFPAVTGGVLTATASSTPGTSAFSACRESTADLGHMEVTKVVDLGGAVYQGDEQFEICLTGPDASPDVVCQTIGWTGGTLSFDSLAAGQYVVSETAPGPEWMVTIDPAGGVVSVPAGGVGVATVTNRLLTGNIVVSKATDPVGDPTIFAFTASWDSDGFWLGDGGSEDSGALAPGTYSVEEVPVFGWTASVVCSDGQDPLSIILAGGQTVSCAFTNTPERTAHIEVTKVVDLGGAIYQGDEQFQICLTGPDPSTDVVCQPIPQFGPVVFDSLAAGQYIVSEIDPGPEWMVTIEPASGVVSVPAGGVGTATVTNRLLTGNIIVSKATDPAGEPTSFSFVASWGAGAFTLSDGESIDSGPLTLGVYSVEEVPVDGWSTSVTCYNPYPQDPLWIQLDSGQTVTCTFTNTLVPITPGHIQVTKIVDWGSVPPTAPPSFEICIWGPMTDPSLSCQLATVGPGNMVDLTWEVSPGTYEVRETDPGPEWGASIDPGSVEVLPGQTVSGSVLNIRLAP